MKRTTTLFILFWFISFNSLTGQKAESNSPTFIGFNHELSYLMMEPNQDLRKVLLFANLKKEGLVDKNTLTFGASIIAIGDYQKTNRDSKFAYLMRHPTATNQIGYEMSEAVLHSFQFAVIGSVNSWLNMYAEILYNPEQSFGAGTITTLERNQLQLRKGFVFVGDLNKFPIYGAIGKMDAPFGLGGSVNPFTNSTMWHAFGGLGYGAQVGFNKWGLSTTFMAVQGGSQFRAMNTIVGDSTDVPSLLNNFVFDIRYSFQPLNNLNLMLGYSYMHGSAYGQGFPITHFNPGEIDNPANTVYTQLDFGKRLKLMGAYAITQDVWPGAYNPFPPLDEFRPTPVSSWSAGGRLLLVSIPKWDFHLSTEYSRFDAGEEGCPWERQDQLVFGFSSLYNKSSKLFLEVFQTKGFVPLNFMSGSDPFDPFPPGETHSDRDATSFGFVFGAQLTL